MITRTVWILSLVSLLTDTASEMLYPVMPLYLQSIGFTIVGIGLLEGLAEAVAGLSKGYFGKWSDDIGKRLPFVQLGYLLSAISKPLMSVLTYPLWIFSVRSLDRIGKGLRSGPRDALLSNEATSETKARIFGFHRSMDTAGAALGPLIALLFLYYHPGAYKPLFLLAFLPGLFAVAASLFLKEKTGITTRQQKVFSLRAFYSYWIESADTYRKLATPLLIFALVNSSDIFLLLKMKEAGLPDTWLIGTYIFYNAVYAASAYPAGIMADRFGLKKTLVLGLILFSISYAAMAFAGNLSMFVLVFLGYGLYAAATEGVSKAWLSNIVPRNETAAAIGTFSGFQSIAALIASTVGGLVWYAFGSTALFVLAAALTLIIAVYIYLNVPISSAQQA
ncbi:MFS transporter [Segetibacter sp. 3557_3]|uniref:MFS transporter n=1 Tax=Segetibacter sp. 3557_3 TaxID=2547429 RepID=UPI001058871F|nr:MFS transporter [Segetibacter sp. 3557_3]TDH28908.1 MFS transporter [Segetibacter sp. 3557_3]